MKYLAALSLVVVVACGGGSNSAKKPNPLAGLWPSCSFIYGDNTFAGSMWFDVEDDGTTSGTYQFSVQTSRFTGLIDGYVDHPTVGTYDIVLHDDSAVIVHLHVMGGYNGAGITGVLLPDWNTDAGLLTCAR